VSRSSFTTAGTQIVIHEVVKPLT